MLANIKKIGLPLLCLLQMSAIFWWTLPHSFGGMIAEESDQSTIEAQLFKWLSFPEESWGSHLLTQVIDVTGSQQYWDFFAPQSPKFHQYLSVCNELNLDKLRSGAITCKGPILFSNLKNSFKSRELCESDFEREMFDFLVKNNYRVKPQVKCGSYRLDFVVEGNEGRRLAVECDGDRFHGPGQWMDDMNRQRVLERIGWTFWRCFASSFVLHREEVTADLLKILNDMGIEPLGTESVDNTKWSLSKIVDPYGHEGPSEEDDEDDNGESTTITEVI